MRLRTNGRRSGFSLVEVMVSLALIIFIMSILSAAFAAASKSFRDLKSAGDLAEKLRGVTTILRRDLAAPHFGDNRRLSDGTFWNDLERGRREGFVRIHQGRAINAATESFGPTIPEHINTTASLHFTVRQSMAGTADVFMTDIPMPTAPNPDQNPSFTAVSGAQRERRFQTLAPTSRQFRSEWAEIAYWLTPALDANNNQIVSDPEGTPQLLYTLRRRQRLLWPYGRAGVTFPNPPIDEISSRLSGGAQQVNSPRAITMPPTRFGMLFDPAIPTSAAGTFAAGGNYPANVANDVVLNDVLSFDVRVLLDGATNFVTLDHATVQAFSHNNPAFPATGPFCFDTWSDENTAGYDYKSNAVPGPRDRWEVPGAATSIPLYKLGTTGAKIRIRAIKITLRIYDANTNQTRQVSMVQDM